MNSCLNAVVQKLTLGPTFDYWSMCTDQRTYNSSVEVMFAVRVLLNNDCLQRWKTLAVWGWFVPFISLFLLKLKYNRHTCFIETLFSRLRSSVYHVSTSCVINYNNCFEHTRVKLWLTNLRHRAITYCTSALLLSRHWFWFFVFKV